MLIANPIFDVIFKQLMQNTRIARFLIETLTEETIEDLQIKPQEFVYTKGETRLFAVMRYDFIATIRTSNGDYKKVLIEIQKAKNAIDLMRFRNYLGEQYKSEDEVVTESGTRKMALPIVTIYLLGFDLPGIDAAAVKVARNYTDLLTHQVINRKSDFIEQLSHDCYIVQMSKVQTKVQTSLEELLSVFEQTNFFDNKGLSKVYNHEIKNEIVKSMLSVLEHAVSDPVSRKEIEIEQEAWRTIDALSGEKLRDQALQLMLKDKELAKKDNELSKKDNELSLKDNELSLKDNELSLKDNELSLKDNELSLKDNELSMKDNELSMKDNELSMKDKELEEKEKAFEDERKAKEEVQKANDALAQQLADLKRKMGLD